MHHIQNNTIFTLAVCANEFSLIIPAGGGAEVPDDVADVWVTRDTPRAFIDAGQVIVTTVEDEVEADFSSPAADAAAEGDLSKLHHTKVIALVKSESDLDALAELHASEERPSVLKAIETRITELRV